MESFTIASSGMESFATAQVRACDAADDGGAELVAHPWYKSSSLSSCRLSMILPGAPGGISPLQGLAESMFGGGFWSSRQERVQEWSRNMVEEYVWDPSMCVEEYGEEQRLCLPDERGRIAPLARAPRSETTRRTAAAMALQAQQTSQPSQRITCIDLAVPQ